MVKTEIKADIIPRAVVRAGGRAGPGTRGAAGRHRGCLGALQLRGRGGLSFLLAAPRQRQSHRRG